MIGKLWRGIMESVDSAGKIGAAGVTLIAIASAVPWLDGQVKRATGALFGVKGAVYYEVGPDGDAMFASPHCDTEQENCPNVHDEENNCASLSEDEAKPLDCRTDGGLFLLRDGYRSYCNLRAGDVLQAGTDKNFRSLDKGKNTTVVEETKKQQNSSEEKTKCANLKAANQTPEAAEQPQAPSPDSQPQTSNEWDPDVLNKNPKIFVLRRGECVVVLEPLVEKRPTYASSGGWLKVATTACGLFR